MDAWSIFPSCEMDSVSFASVIKASQPINKCKRRRVFVGQLYSLEVKQWAANDLFPPQGHAVVYRLWDKSQRKLIEAGETHWGVNSVNEANKSTDESRTWSLWWGNHLTVISDLSGIFWSSLSAAQPRYLFMLRLSKRNLQQLDLIPKPWIMFKSLFHVWDMVL